MSLMTRFEHGAIRKGFILEEVVHFSFICFFFFLLLCSCEALVVNTPVMVENEE